MRFADLLLRSGCHGKLVALAKIRHASARVPKRIAKLRRWQITQRRENGKETQGTMGNYLIYVSEITFTMLEPDVRARKQNGRFGRSAKEPRIAV